MGNNIESIDQLIQVFLNMENEITFDKICKFNNDENKEYKRLLKEFKRTNASNCTTNEKGKALEDLATYTIKTSHVFEVYKNIRTNTNELDQLVKLTNTGKILASHEILDKRLMDFIGECKNYKDKIPVTYVGKVCSLLLTTQIKICILFSYKGVTGRNWEESSGLIKKIYLSKEDVKDRYCIIDFNINDFEDIDRGNNFLQIIDNKIMALKIDTDYRNLISEHELTPQIMSDRIQN